MAFRVDYTTVYRNKDYSVTSGGALKSGFKTYEEAAKYVAWAKENLIHDEYKIVETN